MLKQNLPCVSVADLEETSQRRIRDTVKSNNFVLCNWRQSMGNMWLSMELTAVIYIVLREMLLIELRQFLMLFCGEPCCTEHVMLAGLRLGKDQAVQVLC